MTTGDPATSPFAKLSDHPRRALGIIVVVYLALGILYLVIPPIFEKPDENWHFA